MKPTYSEGRRLLNPGTTEDLSEIKGFDGGVLYQSNSIHVYVFLRRRLAQTLFAVTN